MKPPCTRDAPSLAGLYSEPLPLAGRELTPAVEQRMGSYQMRFARTESDLEDVGRLRFTVFNLELDEGLPESYTTGIDRDEFDAQCQHLMVHDTLTGEVVGTYRMQTLESAVRGVGFYSDVEFDFSTIPESVLMDSIELGRACVARAHRNRGVLFLLWSGLFHYLVFNRRSGFFGCSSLTSRDPSEGLRFYAQLERAGSVHPTLRIHPRPDFACIADAPGTAPVKTPKLFGLYLKYGAQVLGPPAIDRGFGTIDFLTYHAPRPAQLRKFAGYPA